MEHKDVFDDFVDLNKEQFDSFEPSSALWEKIQNKQKKQLDLRSAASIFLKIAVAIVLLFGVYVVSDIGIKKHETDFANNTPIQQDEFNSELVEAQTYYAQEIKSKLAQLEHDAKKYPEIWNETQNELTLLDNEYKQLQQELHQSISNDEVVGAIIQNYKFKLQIIEKINEVINEQEAQKNTFSHEM